MPADDRRHHALPKEITIGELSARSGVATSALRFYEAEGLIRAHRNRSGHRRYEREALRQVGFVRAAQTIGLTLAEIRDALAELPAHRAPTAADWNRLATAWRPRLDARIAYIERVRDYLGGCIGCGCLSMQACPMVNPDDALGADGPGARTLTRG